MKASDEWCVPLCRHHHTGADGVHRVGSKMEEAWFRERGIDDVRRYARRLFLESPFNAEPSVPEPKRRMRTSRRLSNPVWKRKVNGTVVRRKK